MLLRLRAIRPALLLAVVVLLLDGLIPPAAGLVAYRSLAIARAPAPAASAGPPAVAAHTTRPAPALRPRGIPPADFVPAPLRIQAASSPRPTLLLAPPEADPEELISQGAKARASSYYPGAGGGRPQGLSFSFDEFAPRPPWQANDGDLNTPWSSDTDALLPHWWLVDVGKTYTMTKLLTHWGSPDGQLYDYFVEVSSDGSTYTQVASQSGASGQTTDTFEVPGRYLRVTIEDNGLGGTDDMAWVNEFQVYGILAMPDDQGSPCPCENPQGTNPPGPFNPRTGFLWTSATDLQVPSSGLALALDWTRTYVSRAITETTGPLGIGWQHPYNSRVITETMPGGEPGLAIVVAPDGNRWRFQATGLSIPFGNEFHSLAGIPHTFVQHFEFNPTFHFTPTYQLTTRDQQLWTYDDGGRLIRMQDAQGHRLTLTYSPTNTAQLERIADEANPERYLALTYDDGRIARVSDGIRFVTYTYSTTGDLIRATDVMSRPTDYTYQDHLLTKITNALGQTVEQTTYDQYTPKGRVIEQTLLDGRHYDVDYQPLATEMTITGPDGREEVPEYRYDESETLTSTSVNGQVQSSSDFEEHFAPGSRSDANGNTTSAVFNAAGQPLTVTNALEQSTLSVYDSQNHPISVTDTLGRQTASVYDDHNNLVSQTTGITTAFPLGFANFYTYTAEQRLLAQSGPDGVVTRNAYDAQGQVISRTLGYGTPLAQTTTYGYDRYGRVVTTTVGFATPLARVDVTRYNADDTIAETIANYQDGVFTPSKPDEDILSTYGYDGLGRQAWVRDVLGHYDVTHYDARGLVDWRAGNFVQGGWSGGALPSSPPAYSPATPDQNVATFYGIDGLGRTAFVTETGILTGTFDVNSLQFSQATQRVTRTAFDTLNRPVTVTLNYRPGLSAGADRNVQLLTRYDTAGNMIGQRDALGRWTTTEYDALNRPITVTVNYENGNPLTVDVANQGWTDGSDTDIVSVTRYRPDGAMDRRIENYVNGIFTATEPITDRITLYEYDALSRVVTTTLNYDPPTLGSRTDTNRSSVMAYDGAIGRVTGQRDPLNRWVSQQYDLLGRVTTTIQNCTGGSAPAGCGTLSADANVPMTMHYDALGRAFETVDALGHVMHTRYDGLDRSTKTIQNYVAPGTPTNAITNVTTLAAYDGLGRTTIMTDALGYATRQVYNGLSQTTIVTDSMGRVTRMGYDGQGALRWTRRPDGQLTVVQVDGLGRTVATIVNYADGAVGGSEPADQDLITRTVYDLAGRRTRTIDPANRVTAYAYDQLDRLITVTENAVTGSCPVAPCNVVTQYHYDRAGNRTAIVDARGNVRTFAYDAASQQTIADDPVHPPTTWEYDLGGRMTVQHDPRGITNTLSFAYDGLDRRTQTAATNLGTITAAYDALGRRTSLADGTGTTSFAYDPLNRIKQVTAPQTSAVGYGYDARGARSSLSYPSSGPTLTYAYWPDGQIRTVTDTTTLASYSYDSLGRLATTTRANGQSTSSSYDQADRLRSLTTTVGSTTASAFAYQVNRLGLRTVVTETLGISTPPVVPVVDDLNDFGTMVAHTTNLGFDTSNASYFGGDASRLRRESTSGAWAVWHLEGMDAFTAVSYHWSGEALGDFTFFASPDTSSYTPITPTMTTASGEWVRVQYDLSLPAGTNYVKVVFPTTSSQSWNPQLSQVAYRRPALPPAAESPVDALDDFSAMADHAANLGFDTSNASSFGGDASRLRRESTSGAWAVWHLERMDAFTAVSYHWSGEALGDFTFFASPDNSSYTPITPTVTTTAGDWLRVVDDLRLPAGTNYVKVVFPTTSSQFWNPQLSQVAYRRPASAATRVIAYSYDGLLRLTGAAESPGTTYAYAYDDAGNRTGVWVNGTRILTQTYDAADQVVGGSYDAAGNLLSDGTSTFAYDALNRLTLQGTTTNSYNGDDVLVHSGTITYTQDLASPLSQVLQTKQGGTITNHLYGVGRLASVSGGTRTWYGVDALSSVRQTLNNSGAVLGTVNYDPWGSVESGSVPTFGFTGEIQDSGGMVYLRARWYNASSGTFTSHDPFAGFDTQPTTLHPYLYVGNNPINLTDPSGKCYPPLEGLRDLEPLNCSNLDAAGRIFWNPNANLWQRGLALSYVTAWTAGHVCAIVGASILTVEAGTAIANGSALVRLQAAAAAAPAVLRWMQGFLQRAPSVWQLPPFQRGVEIEQRIGHNVPASFPTIDRWNPATGEAASIKSLDLAAATYQSIPTLIRTVTNYINSVSNYSGQPTAWGGLQIPATAIRIRVLDLAIPASGATQAQLDELIKLQQFAQTVSVTLNIH